MQQPSQQKLPPEQSQGCPWCGSFDTVYVWHPHPYGGATTSEIEYNTTSSKSAIPVSTYLLISRVMLWLCTWVGCMHEVIWISCSSTACSRDYKERKNRTHTCNWRPWWTVLLFVRDDRKCMIRYFIVPIGTQGKRPDFVIQWVILRRKVKGLGHRSNWRKENFIIPTSQFFLVTILIFFNFLSRALPDPSIN